MKVQDIMSRDLCLAEPQQSLRDAARLMSERDVGALPVREADRLVGMIPTATLPSAALPKARGQTPRCARS
jgi:CBS domain-containing protein